MPSLQFWHICHDLYSPYRTPSEVAEAQILCNILLAETQSPAKLHDALPCSQQWVQAMKTVKNFATKNTSQTRNLSSHIHAGSAFDRHMTQIFDLLTSGLVHARWLPCTVWKFNVIAQVIFLLECGTHTYRHTKSHVPLITLHTHQLLEAHVIKRHIMHVFKT